MRALATDVRHAARRGIRSRTFSRRPGAACHLCRDYYHHQAVAKEYVWNYGILHAGLLDAGPPLAQQDDGQTKHTGATGPGSIAEAKP